MLVLGIIKTTNQRMCQTTTWVLPFSVSLATQQAVRHALVPTLLWSFAVGVLRDADSGLARAARATRLCSFTWAEDLREIPRAKLGFQDAPLASRLCIWI